ncbi:Bud site selection protein bud4 [Agyrium rufum]|nr:Bud site selection protein bud4 [Agyrium rufum]
MAQSIQPLRIQKGTSSNLSSPVKMNSSPAKKPLGEISPTERRRNSPSFNQATKAMFGENSSPFDPSPATTNSPRLYWQSRDPASPSRLSIENRSPYEGRGFSPSPTKRSSIENLKRASRVKNSNMFAREQKNEYDPTTTPQIERPLAAGRPLSGATQTNVQVNVTIDSHLDSPVKIKSNELTLAVSTSPTKPLEAPGIQTTAHRDQVSPVKSSLSKNSRYAQAQAFDPPSGIWSDDDDSFADRQLPAGRGLHRHAKSVTFDVAPPQINEYEQRTPDPSSVASGSREGSYESQEDDEESFDRGSSMDRDEDSFDASLEDTEKTPVVLPEDWRFMSPELANHELTAKMEDVFAEPRSSPAPTIEPIPSVDARSSPTRTDSAASNGERRPLPPLPGLNLPAFSQPKVEVPNSLSATATRVSASQRNLPSPPRPASISKADLQDIGSYSSFSLEDRLRLMMVQDPEKPKTAAEEQRERRLRRHSPRREESIEPETQERTSEIQVTEKEVDDDDQLNAMAEFKLPPRISRESILRKVKSQQSQNPEDEYACEETASSPIRGLDHIDPDTPLPSLEDPSMQHEDEDSVVIKQEEDSEVDVYAIPEMYRLPLAARVDIFHASSESQRTSLPESDDGESHYSNEPLTDVKGFEAPSTLMVENERPATPPIASPQPAEVDSERKKAHRMSLPHFASLLADDDFGLGLQSYLTPSPPLSDDLTKPSKSFDINTAYQSADRPVTPQEQLSPPKFSYGSIESEEPGTPESVIRHPIAESPRSESPGIPEPAATIKAPGSRLKTRPSLTPADTESMANTRRQVSGPLAPRIPSISESSTYSTASGTEVVASEEQQIENNSQEHKQSKRKSSLVPLDLSVHEAEDEDLSLGLDREFDRLMEAQKVANVPFSSILQSTHSHHLYSTAEYMPGQGFRLFDEHSTNMYSSRQKGYLMRQNTKIVVATSTAAERTITMEAPRFKAPEPRGTRSAGNSPRKPSNTPTWTTEPWNGKMRRKSIRQSAGSPQKRITSGNAPPMPGQESNVTTGLDSVDEDLATESADFQEDGAERGRLFVKVVGVKELDMPLPRGERSYFALTLDNGLHCVTTSWLELGKYAPIGQEFELVVLNDLEFQLTLQTKLEEPKVVKKPIESTTKTPKAQKPSTFSRVFASPKKRKELEFKQQQETEKAAKQKQADAQASKRNILPTAWDLLHNMVAKDGSFARAYVSLKDHEKKAFGRPYTVDIPCFNEWATEEIRPASNSGNNSRASRSSVVSAPTPAVRQRKAPYKIGKLELQLLYVPKPAGAKEDDMPKSMNSAIRELQEVENVVEKTYEGCLSQQGGDCPYWRRRFFRLTGSKLTAFHEHTRQPRATINLAKAAKLIDDKSSLTQKEVSGRGGSRRKSAFAEEEEGYMFVEEGFRVRFANGETIDFYANSAAEKDGWMKALSEVVGKDVHVASGGSGARWTDLVMEKRKAEGSVGRKSVPAASSSPEKRVSSHEREKVGRPASSGTLASSASSNHHHSSSSGTTGLRKGLGHHPPAPVEKDTKAHGTTPATDFARPMGPEARKQKTRSMIF